MVAQIRPGRQAYSDDPLSAPQLRIAIICRTRDALGRTTLNRRSLHEQG